MRLKILEDACAITHQVAEAVESADWEKALDLVKCRNDLLQTMPQANYDTSVEAERLIERESSLILAILTADRQLNDFAKSSKASLAARIERERRGNKAGNAYLEAASS